MNIPEDKIQEIIQAADIVDVISKYVRLRKTGVNYKGLCPFHTEKTPSFSVNAKKQIFYCFGCHKGGNAIKFLMEYNNLSFLDSVKELAREYGIDLPARDERGEEEQKKFEEYFDITKATIRFFADNLTKNSSNKHILEYLKNRNVNDLSIQNFGIGYGGGVRGKLIEFYQKNGYDTKKAIELGFLGESEGKIYERFSGRLIFPIYSHHGREIGAGGRILEKRSDTGKYINSPESPIYNKSKVLYGLSHSKDEIRKVDYVIVVEGYLDVISLYQNGIKNIVAVSGTALTDDQVKLLSSYTKNFYLLFDSDSAGYKAALRSIEIVMKHNLNLKIMSLPEGEDPDSFVQKHGEKEFLEYVKNAREFIDYQYLVFEREGYFQNPDRMTEALKEMLRPVAMIPDVIKRTLFQKAIADKFKLREKVLEEEIERFREKEIESRALELKEKPLTEQLPVVTGGQKVVTKDTIERNPLSAFHLNEIEIIKLMFEGDEKVVRFIFQFIRPEEYTVPIHYGIAEKVFEELDAGTIPTVNNLKDHYSKEEQEYILDLVMDKYKISEHLDDLLPTDSEATLSLYTIDAVKKFRLLRIDEMLKEIQKEIATAKDSMQIGQLVLDLKTYLEEKQDISKIMDELKMGIG